MCCVSRVELANVSKTASHTLVQAMTICKYLMFSKEQFLVMKENVNIQHEGTVTILSHITVKKYSNFLLTLNQNFIRASKNIVSNGILSGLYCSFFL